MKIGSISQQNFGAKIIGLKPIADKAAKAGMSQESIERAISKIQKYFPDKNDSVIIAQQEGIFYYPTGVGVSKNGVFRFTEIMLEEQRNDLYKIVGAVKKLSSAKFTQDLDFLSID